MTKWKNFSTRSTATVEQDFTGLCEVHVKGAGGNAFRAFESHVEANAWLRKCGFKTYNRFTKSWE